MTDPDNSAASVPQQETHPPLREPFPFLRLLYAAGFAIAGWVVFWLVLFLGALQFLTIAITGQANDELRHFTRNMTRYLFEILSYVTLVQDERPFPFGPFPKV